MKVKTGICITENCTHCRNKPETPLISKRCNGSYWQYRASLKNPKETKARQPIKPISDKQAKLNAAYLVLRKKFLEDHPNCFARFTGCTIMATDIHHKAGRGMNMLNDSTFIQLCRSCHSWIELHPYWAKENGFSFSRLGVEPIALPTLFLFTLDETTLKDAAANTDQSSIES